MDPASSSVSTPSSVSSSREVTPRLDAINLMLRDLHTRHDEIRHRAAFRGCTSELLTLQQELVDYLLSKKHSLQGAENASPDEGLNYNSFT
ncbi:MULTISPECIES: hypothetical protein [Cyanophyceae]|jgi:hypothetical protein|uniref:Uncharacterized protein n=1 Tax=Aphanothece cf. minutissima CCALA 015 TaxID=2107695 RepID=A0ABX5F3S4_9CHRO|nr:MULTISPECIES: hypothetical protein [Cyanophyceae]MCP9799112.1 hypothetical protein [Cyanobium sp. Lug-B]MCP9935331.1 hypothetical protein [Cyanobium sp. Candia 9D4]PSB35916.1 hypothetical protein C7B81_15750 [Aphanothece cf. minutissima CCALA 015]